MAATAADAGGALDPYLRWLEEINGRPPHGSGAELMHLALANARAAAADGNQVEQQYHALMAVHAYHLEYAEQVVRTFAARLKRLEDAHPGLAEEDD